MEGLMTERLERTCPKCGKTYTDYPALSREDNATEICPDCGIREALESIGIGAIERETILEILHSHNALYRKQE